MRNFILLLGLAFLLSAPAVAQESDSRQSQRMTPELLWQLGRLGEAAVSDKGQYVAYLVTRYDLNADNSSRTLYLYDIQNRQTRTLLADWPVLANLQFANSVFGERIFLVGSPERGKAPQALAVNPADGSTLQITDFEQGCSNLKVAPTGRHIAFTQKVEIEPPTEALKEGLSKANARIYDQLMVRHWDSWKTNSFSHLHVAPLGSDGKAGTPIDLMEGLQVDSPVPPFGGTEQFDWSPDGRSIAYTMKDVERWAESTDSDVYLTELSSPKARVNLTEGMPGYERDPLFSPDGKYLAFNSMERASFEADRPRIMVRELASGKVTEATRNLDRWVHGTAWLPDSSGFIFSSEEKGTSQLYRVARTGGPAKAITKGRADWGLKGLLPNGRQAVASFAQTERPDELMIVDLGSGSSQKISSINDSALSRLALPTVEERWIPTTDGKSMHAWVVLPPNFDPNRKYPMLTYCQGGPQGQIGQWFSYRWNFHLMAAQDYVVLLPNRRGMPGFGQAWNDDISLDWGGQAMSDILTATDALAAEPYVDETRMAAVGPSFGGYTVFWLMGHHEDRFSTMIAHCGVFNLESMYGTTEELFFVNWELGGPYWKSAEVGDRYQRFSPHNYVENWDTPLLVIHNEKDYRVPISQGLEAFTAAQVQGVPSRMLVFPEENHWVLKPQNAILWQRVFFDWLEEHCKNKGQTADAA